MKAEPSLPLLDWRPLAVVIPFPLVRRRDFVCKHGDVIASLRPDKAAAYLERTLKVQRDVMIRRGVAADRISLEIAALERRLTTGTIVMDGRR
jgi:hypothetical protein